MWESENVMCSALSIVIYEEMKCAYDSLWTALVKVQPPWTLSEVIGNINK